ncbi:MAG: hypothetical protein ACOYJI_02860 [Anaerovoracaceae bacterium]|jgi:hypothetical protein
MDNSEKNTNRSKTKKAAARWIAAVIAVLLAALAVIAAMNAVVDPFFHFHGPLDGLQYPIDNERYQNDGITRNFDYDAIITGSSMAENFKTSQFDELFGVKSIKVPFSGGRYKEVNDNITRSYESGHDLNIVLRSLDYSLLVLDKDDVYPGAEYPTYLTDDNPFNDIKYLLNLTVFFDDTLRVFSYTNSGQKTTSFDDYQNWMDDSEFGADVVFSTYTLGTPAKTEKKLSDHDRELIRGNLEQNVISQAEAHPETTFYIFFPPYSIAYWDELNNEKKINWRIDAEEYAIDMLLKCDNIKLFSFSTRYDITCNLDNYKDQAHFKSWINDQILEWISRDEYQITEQNEEEYISEIRNFYGSYDYSSLHGDN